MEDNIPSRPRLVHLWRRYCKAYRVTNVKSEDYMDDKWITPSSVHNAVIDRKDEDP